MTVIVAFLALVVDLVVGYPQWFVDRIGHPVTWIGRMIDALDSRFNRAGDEPRRRRAAGLLSLSTLILAAAGTGAFVWWLCGQFAHGWIAAAILAASLIAQRSLATHVGAVATALDTGGLGAGRKAVAMIVGRDTEPLDESGIGRAAIESLAENFSDGVVAPAFWLALGGLPAIVAYKAINTADSMIGHRSEKYIDYGRAAARLDDLVNWPAARLSAGLIVAAAALLPGMSARRALAAVRRDAARHRSPNAGWPEAAFAGALGLELAGPRVYGGTAVDDDVMGAGGRSNADRADIGRALRLFWTADLLMVALAGAGAALVIAFS